MQPQWQKNDADFDFNNLLLTSVFPTLMSKGKNMEYERYLNQKQAAMDENKYQRGQSKEAQELLKQQKGVQN